MLWSTLWCGHYHWPGEQRNHCVALFQIYVKRCFPITPENYFTVVAKKSHTVLIEIDRIVGNWVPSDEAASLVLTDGIEVRRYIRSGPPGFKIETFWELNGAIESISLLLEFIRLVKMSCRNTGPCNMHIHPKIDLAGEWRECPPLQQVLSIDIMKQSCVAADPN